MTRVLFVCGRARKCSPTAADLANRMFDVEAGFAGLSQDTEERISVEQIEWADVIAVMERRQIMRLKRQFTNEIKEQRVICLDVPDRYEYMEDELVEVLYSRMKRVTQD